MQVRSARKASVTRVRDDLPSLNHLPRFHTHTALFQVAIMSQRTVIVPDQNVIVILIKLDRVAPLVRIVADFDDQPAARCIYRSAFRHLPIDGVEVGSFVTYAAIVALSHFELPA